MFKNDGNYTLDATSTLSACAKATADDTLLLRQLADSASETGSAANTSGLFFQGCIHLFRQAHKEAPVLSGAIASRLAQRSILRAITAFNQ
ncbi:hypothetical protein A4D02_23755 [Niastella koreensis]|uniref:Uncharacterized protein n=1 Tax=Niastella koreensis TaxID=354356 RepID=A0ABX3P0T2_9BACT|nr:hypothetical protein A4D02_23755 [Niastella koreensis]